jgi:hypothetical protein
MSSPERETMRFSVAVLRAIHRGSMNYRPMFMAVQASTPGGKLEGVVECMSSLLTVRTTAGVFVEDIRPEWIVTVDVIHGKNGPLLPIVRDRYPAEGEYAHDHQHLHAECGHAARCPWPWNNEPCQAAETFGTCTDCELAESTTK